MSAYLMDTEQRRNGLRDEALRLGGDGLVLDISESKDFQLMKSVVREGDGEQPPSDASHVVRVHYTGRLTSGKIFDSSRNGRGPFTFVLGAGSVIRGWDVGVATMTRGECALLLCSPEYGYGQRAAGPIPAASWLVFDVELLDWHERNQVMERLPAMICYTIVVLGVLIYLRWMHAI
jgi:hypothetical protein